ncbi:hypothetical protein D3C76_1666010 [compost metagenome]
MVLGDTLVTGVIARIDTHIRGNRHEFADGGVKNLVVSGGVGVVTHLHLFQNRIVGQMYILA